MNVTEVYFLVDEVVKQIEQNFVKKGRNKKLSKSEIITILLIGHYEAIPTTKLLYERIVKGYSGEFKSMPCYTQFTRSIRSVAQVFDCLLKMICSMNAQSSRGLKIIDSTALPTNGYGKYEPPKWASDEAETGKNIFGYYHGFKLHIIINRKLEVVSFEITPANVHDVNLLSSSSFMKNIEGLLIGDKGYVASLQVVKKLLNQGVKLIFKQRDNMDPYLNEYYKKYLSQRQVIEGVFSYLKNRLQLLHKFARSTESFLVHVKSALFAYMLRDLDLAIKNFAS